VARTAARAICLLLAVPAGWATASDEKIYGAGCGGENKISIALAGDVIIQPEIEARGRANGIPYRSLWRAIETVTGAVDVAFANIEGPVAVDEAAAHPAAATKDADSAVAQAPSFNYRASLVTDLKSAGFDVVSTGNNHALDRGGAGIDLTMDRLERSGLAFTGTRRRSDKSRWSTLTRTRGFTVGWLACTYGTNGIPDLREQVLYCFNDTREVLSEIARLRDDPAVDAVILVPHWGIENSRVVERRQRDLARSAIEAGALAVVGTHPHVLQEWERVSSSDGREGLVIYSTGNLVSAQTAPDQRIGIIAILELSKRPGAAKARLSGARYVLTEIGERSGSIAVNEAEPSARAAVLPPQDRVRISDLALPCNEN
jgi:poly-gamma-glutamate synthesis protein (capsule biosynthesis protein)